MEAVGREGRFEAISSTEDSSVLETVSRRQLMFDCSNRVFVTSEEALDILAYARVNALDLSTGFSLHFLPCRTSVWVSELLLVTVFLKSMSEGKEFLSDLIGSRTFRFLEGGSS